MHKISYHFRWLCMAFMLFLGGTLFTISPSWAYEKQTNAPRDLKLVYFYANWCPSCAQLDPVLHAARRNLGARAPELVILNFSNQRGQTRDAAQQELRYNAQLARQKGVYPIFRSYPGITGFVKIVNLRSGKEFGCFTTRQTEANMTGALHYIMEGNYYQLSGMIDRCPPRRGAARGHAPRGNERLRSVPPMLR